MKLIRDKLLSSFAFKANLHRYNTVDQRRLEELRPEDAALIEGMRVAAQGPAALQLGRGLHSSTFQLNLSRV